MDKIRDFFRLIRWPNLLFIGILLYVMEKWVAVPLLNKAYFGEQLPWWIMALLMVGCVCIAAGGYVVNDYFDIKIDRINHEDRLIITRTFSKDEAMRIFYVLSAVGMVSGLIASYWAKSWTVGLIFLVIPGLLWFYSASYKRQLFIGNIVVAFTAGLTPLLIALINADYLKHIYGSALHYTPITAGLFSWIGGFALFAVVLTLAREIIKDMEDEMGDREMECHTIPIVFGFGISKIIVTTLFISTLIFIGWLWWSVLPFPHDWSSLSSRYIVLGIVIPLLCATWLLWTAHTPKEYKHAQMIVKFVMFMGVMYSFVIAQLLA